VLGVVDATFRDHDGLGSDAPATCLPAGMPGRVDLWPPVPKPEKAEEERHWTDPVDSTDPKDANQILAEQVAEPCARCWSAAPCPWRWRAIWMRRPVTPGDVMILVQRRSRLFGALIRELKKRDLDVGGADRLKLRSELAVRDIEAVLRFLALPEDCLSLACALKSRSSAGPSGSSTRLPSPAPRDRPFGRRSGPPPPGEARDILDDLRRTMDFCAPTSS
jgi:ATP-dependent helicase/nuclease subunit A